MNIGNSVDWEVDMCVSDTVGRGDNGRVYSTVDDEVGSCDCKRVK